MGKLEANQKGELKNLPTPKSELMYGPLNILSIIFLLADLFYLSAMMQETKTGKDCLDS